MHKLFLTDVIEDDILRLEKEILHILLFDRTTRHNILWATDDYLYLGEEYKSDSEVFLGQVTGEHTLVIQPRTSKSLEEQENRIRKSAEVFTPAWICNQQNNLIDNAWFGHGDVFNLENGTSWIPVDAPVSFPDQKKHQWKNYVDAKRMEISCGEAPYLVSRYDATTGNMFPLASRIGLLDRKLRIVNENTGTKDEWLVWAIRAVQSVYGYEFQGDSLLLARENVFVTFLEYYYDRYQELPEKKVAERVARIISWNLWQMDGLNFVVPFSCKPDVEEEMTLFGKVTTVTPCPGCQNNDVFQHTGIYCRIMDWRSKKSFRYVDLMKGVHA